MATKGPGGNSGALYDLFASLGLDTSGFDAGLLKSDASIKAITERLAILQASSLSAGDAIRTLHAELLKASELQALAARSLSRTTDPRSVIPFNQPDVVKDMMAQAELKKASAQAAALESESAAESKRITNQRILDRKREEDSRRQYTMMVKQYSQQEASAEKARVAAEKATLAEEERIFQERRAAYKARMDDDRANARSNFDIQRQRETEARKAQYGGTVGPGGIGAEIRTSIYLNGIAQMLGLQIPHGLTAVLGRLPAVQMAMASAFDILPILAVITIITQLANKLAPLVDDFMGVGKAAKAAWDEAYEGSRRAGLDLANYIATVGKIENKVGGKKSTELLMEVLIAREEEIREFIKGKMSARASDVNKLAELGATSDPSSGFQSFKESTSWLFPNPEMMSKYSISANNYGEAIHNLQKEFKDLTEDIFAYQKVIASLELQKDRIRAKDENAARDSKKRRDPIHEMPWRLPWFLGENPSQSFLNQLEGAPARRKNFIPEPPTLMHNGTKREPGTVEWDRRPQASIRVENNFSPTINFDGVPADMQAAVRDQIMPQILDDLASNQRASMDKLKTTLQSAGLAHV